MSKSISDRIEIIKGDITKVTTEAIVNAANSSLLGGGGVDGAIHEKGGPEILEACKVIRKKQGGCPTGEAVITTAGNLPADFVIHTVGPIWKDGTDNEAEKLANCYRNSLQLAVDNQIKTVAFPNISTGVYGFPKEDAAIIALKEVRQFLEDHPEIDKVTFVVFDDDNLEIYRGLMQ